MQSSCRPLRFRSTLLAVLLSLWLVTSATGQSLQVRIESLVRAADLGNGRCTVSVVDLADGLSVASYDSDTPMIPASNMKLVTTAAALGVLGSDFQFKTQLHLRGNDLLVIGDGDPAFGDPKLLEAMGMDVEDLLARWVNAAKRAGVTRIGALIIDDRTFDQQRVHAAWPTNQLHKWYCAEVAGLNFNNNCIDIKARYSKPGQSAILTTLPLKPPVVMTNATRSANDNALNLARKIGTNDILVSGKVKRTIASRGFVTVDDPAMFFGRVLRDRLESAGIIVGEVRRVADGETFGGSKLIAEVVTPIGEVVQRCNKDSQNLFAEALIKRVGREATGDPGTWPSGAAAERMFLSRLIGPRAAGFVIDDGSGMSRNNRVSAEHFTALLLAMHQHPKLRKPFRESLSVGGRDGSLRLRFRNKSFTATVHGKSGYIKGVVALSGYLEHENGRYAFSILLNDYHKPLYLGQRTIDRLVAAMDDHLSGRRMDLETNKIITKQVKAD